ncbi:NYN domain-containing protein [Actinospica durhamensis]|uniref:NYN domain-containing protein n=1 Tax=Actinospica durhamensis TaxID=1508375 RepID=A0A941IRC8_9ACTN|nr:NYN domain-containing protein [Actinospica durhamensis]MBR7832166.1 NYN domain-containing protein [Actinospica durhamensis]
MSGEDAGADALGAPEPPAAPTPPAPPLPPHAPEPPAPPVSVAPVAAADPAPDDAADDAAAYAPQDAAAHPADGAPDSHVDLVATLSEPVRARVLDFAAQVAGGLSHAALPASLRPFARFTPAKRARLAATPLAAALEADGVFRGRVAERVRETYPEVAQTLFAGHIPPAADPRDVAAIAYVLRPEGWTLLLEQAELAARESERALADEHLGDEVARLKAEIDTLREQAKSEIDTLKAELTAERREGDSLRRRIRQLEADMRRAQAQAREALAEGGVVQNAAAVQVAAAEAELRRVRTRLTEAEAALESSRKAGKASRGADDLRLRLLLDTISEAAAGLQRELAIAPSSARPADTVEAVRADAIGAHDVEGQARAGDDPALLDAMLALPRAHLIVDGYNVTKTGFPTLSLHEQRIRLLKGLGGIAARTGAEITCVFDGAELAGPVPVPPHKGVRVLFSKGGEIADALIRRLVAAEPQGRPLIVVSSDKEVADGVRRSGARPVPSSMLVRRLGRS